MDEGTHKARNVGFFWKLRMTPTDSQQGEGLVPQTHRMEFCNSLKEFGKEFIPGATINEHGLHICFCGSLILFLLLWLCNIL
jgi:hypothetical protein